MAMKRDREDTKHKSKEEKTVEAEKFAAIDTRALIEMVRKRPALWDTSNVDYRFCSRAQVWQEVCMELFPSYDYLTKSEKHDFVLHVTKKWYNVRDSYRKCTRNRGSRKTNKPYVYSNLLTFLDPVLKPTKNETRSDDDEYQVYYDSDQEDFPRNETQEVYVDDIGVSGVTASKFPKLDTAEPSTSFNQDDGLVPVFSNLIQREEDEDRAFFNSILPSVKKLTTSEKMEFRIKVMTYLKGAMVKKERDPMEDDFE